VTTNTRRGLRLLIGVGNALTVVGCVGVVLVAASVIPPGLLEIGNSSGIRVIGTVAVAGCLLSAIGYGFMDYFEQQ
jgi:ABC-type cobalamin transport system permease subunit